MIENIETFLSIVPVGVVIVDKDKKIVSMNPYARDVILSKEYFNKDILGLHEKQEAISKIENFFSKLTENKAIELPIVKILDFKGKSMFFIVKLTKIYDKEENFNGIVSIFYDITSVTIKRIDEKDSQHPKFVLDKIPIVSKDRVVFLETRNIMFIRSFGSSTLITDIDGNEYLTSLKISELQEKLEDNGFFRSHKSYLINTSYLKELSFDKEKNQYKLILSSDKKSFFVPLSKRNKQKLNNLLSL